MRDQTITVDHGELVVGADPVGGCVWLELTPTPDERDLVTVRLAAGELLMTIEALAMAYAELCGAQPVSLARGVNRTIRNRTQAASRSVETRRG